MTRPRSRDVLDGVLRIALASLLGYAGVAKLLQPATFAAEIRNYQLLPVLAPHLALVLPVLECVTAVALLVPSLRRAGALLAAGLMATFVVAVSWVLAHDIDIACGCFGKGSASITSLTLARNLALFAAAAYLVVADGRRDDMASSLPPAGGASDSGAGLEGRPT